MKKIIKVEDWHSPPAGADVKLARVRKTYAAASDIQKTVVLRQERPK